MATDIILTWSSDGERENQIQGRDLKTNIVQIMPDRVILSLKGRKEAMIMSYERISPAASAREPKTKKR